MIEGIQVLEVTPEAEALASSLLADSVIPATAVGDAVHLAVAAVHKMDFLLTWNCRHLANAELTCALNESIASHGFMPPVICTPDELLEQINAL